MHRNDSDRDSLPRVRRREPVVARAVALSLLAGWLAPRAARGEDMLSYKYQKYEELGGRIRVETQGAHLVKDIGTASRLKLEGIVDTLAGATPTGQPAPAGSTQVPLSLLHERRKAWNAELSHQFDRANLALGVANSRESDYVSTGWSVQARADFNQKNTTLLAGVAGTDDRVKVFYQPARASKDGADLILGLAQLLSPHAVIALNLTWSHQSGYLSDPYKLVQRDTEIIPGVFLPLTFPEHRPKVRDKGIAWVNLKWTWPELKGTLDASYRLYHDSFGIGAHTVELAWFQRWGEHWIVRPAIRFHDQAAADFYHYRLDGTAIVPAAGAPPAGGPHYSSDYRLSAFRSLTPGLKVAWNATARLQFDAAIEWYSMRGTDGETPQSAYVRARILTIGAAMTW